MNIIKVLAIVLIVVLTICGCSKTENHDMTFATDEKDMAYTFKATDDSQPLHISTDTLDVITQYINNIEVDYVYSDLYKTEEVMKRLDTDINVSKHQYSSLDSNGKLTADSLYQCVIKNNEEFFDSLKSGEDKYDEINSDYLIEICQLIVDSINSVFDICPEIDVERVYCNLGNLKILYDVTTFDFAHVTSDMVMGISENMLVASEAVNGEFAARNTIIHEAMHIIQTGCSCEEIPDCKRRCGIVQYCEEFELNTTDFTWLPEASAERMTCNITGQEPMTYVYAVNYLCSLNLVTMLQSDVPANYIETISFYDDVNKLYDLFGCETDAEKLEILNMLISIDVIQQQPEPLMQAYAEKFGVNVEDDAVTSELFCTLKPGICLTMAKNFYRNLANVLAEREDVSANDVCYLIGLFEATLDYHMKVSKSDYDKYNAELKETYKALRTKFFDSVNSENGVDLATYYFEYSILDGSTEEQEVNAVLEWLDEDKQAFLLERTGVLELNLGVKVH